MKLISIVPNFAPASDGIGDYALSFAREFRAKAAVHSHFVVANPSWRGETRVEEFEVSHLPSRSTTDLLKLLSCISTDLSAVLLLHYEGYGYAQRGCPLWLVKALEQWRAENKQRRLVTMFHELYATGPPWTSAFWLSSLQKNLTTRLARLSDQWMTSLERYAETVRRFSQNTTARAYSLPVFSSIGEPVAIRRLAERRRRMVVFGTRGRRIEVYQRSSADLNRICQRLGITEILDIGRAIEFDFAGELTVPVQTLGEMPGAEIGRLLLDAVAGVIDYPAAMLGKSTIFAAYCAHRVIPVIAPYGDSTPAEGLKANQHFWLTNVESERLNLDTGQVIADNAFAWYQPHSLSAHAETFAACLWGNEHPANENAAQVGG
jgi:hypothetical protein